jgi:hypothetical protein
VVLERVPVVAAVAVFGSAAGLLVVEAAVAVVLLVLLAAAVAAEVVALFKDICLLSSLAKKLPPLLVTDVLMVLLEVPWRRGMGVQNGIPNSTVSEMMQLTAFRVLEKRGMAL